MANIGNIATKYDKLVIFDTETTGLAFNRDEIIEFSAVVLETRNGEAFVVQEYDNLVQLTPGNTVPPEITQLTGSDPETLWESNIFGKSVYELIQEGLTAKVVRLPEDVRAKFRGSINRIVNEGATGLICLIL